MSTSSAFDASAALAWANAAVGVNRTVRTASRIRRAKRVMSVSLRCAAPARAQEEGREREQPGGSAAAAQLAARAAAVAATAATAARGERTDAGAGAGDALRAHRAAGRVAGGHVPAGIVDAAALVTEKAGRAAHARAAVGDA